MKRSIVLAVAMLCLSNAVSPRDSASPKDLAASAATFAEFDLDSPDGGPFPSDQ